jgi:hypothetical protein
LHYAINKSRPKRPIKDRKNKRKEPKEPPKKPKKAPKMNPKQNRKKRTRKKRPSLVSDLRHSGAFPMD